MKKTIMFLSLCLVMTLGLTSCGCQDSAAVDTTPPTATPSAGADYNANDNGTVDGDSNVSNGNNGMMPDDMTGNGGMTGNGVSDNGTVNDGANGQNGTNDGNGTVNDGTTNNGTTNNGTTNGNHNANGDSVLDDVGDAVDDLVDGARRTVR